jgi:hypothetical protein
VKHGPRAFHPEATISMFSGKGMLDQNPRSGEFAAFQKTSFPHRFAAEVHCPSRSFT